MRLKIAILIATLSFGAQAEDIGAKPPLKVDFNSMITHGNQERSALVTGIHTNIANQKHTNKAAPDEQKATDLIDLEIGWGEAPPPIVDRRFDSVQGPEVMSPEDMNEDSN